MQTTTTNHRYAVGDTVYFYGHGTAITAVVRKTYADNGTYQVEITKGRTINGYHARDIIIVDLIG